MARIRTIKPEFFDDPDVNGLSPLAALLFAGLFTQADRRGRLVDEPKRLKYRLMPGRDVDVNDLLDELHAAKMVIRYEADGRKLLWIRTFERHQQPHIKEAESVLAPYEPGASTVPAPDKHEASPPVSGSGKGTVYGEGKAAAPPTAPLAPRLVTNHAGCASCGRVCVPPKLHDQFRRAIGGDEYQADIVLSDWYRTVHDAWGEEGPHARDNPGADAFKFWKARFDEWRPAAPSRPAEPEFDYDQMRKNLTARGVL